MARMAEDDVIRMQGEVRKDLPNATFRVKLENEMWAWGRSRVECVFASARVTR